MFKYTKKNLVYLLVLILPFCLFFAKPSLFTSLKLHIVRVTTVPFHLLYWPLNEIKKILYYHRTFEEYKQLKQEVSVLKTRMIGLEEIIRENTRLERLLAFKGQLVYSSIAASVIGREPSHWNAALIINKGRQDGLSDGLAVINALGVVGKTAEVGTRTSKVILLTDPQFSVAGLVQEPRESGLVTGSLQGLCRMRYLEAGSQVRPGNKVITSKLSSNFPEGLLIGEIIEVINGSDNPSPECIIQPAVSLSQIEEVLVILN